LAGTHVTQLVIDLAQLAGGDSGDGAADTVTLNATSGNNTINLSGATSALITVTGLPATATIRQFETGGTLDLLTILALDGNDTISASGLEPHLTTLLVDGGGGNDTIRSNGDGSYLGGAGDDLIFAGLTNTLEVLDGGSGIDTRDTTSWTGVYSINMNSGVTNYSGESFVNFENLITGSGDDWIWGTAGANVIRTNGGIDTVVAGDGDDTVEGGADGDVLDGGAGIDLLSYASSNAGVTVSLAPGSASGGHAEGDTISGFENLSGSAFADVL